MMPRTNATTGSTLHSRLLRIAARRVGVDAAEDVVQAAYLQVWAHREYGPDRLCNAALLVRATVNAARDEIRRRQRHLPTVPLRPWHGGAGDPEQEALLSIALREAIALASQCPVVLAYAVGYTDTEIGQRRGMSRFAVKSKLHRDRMVLRALRREVVA